MVQDFESMEDNMIFLATVKDSVSVRPAPQQHQHTLIRTGGEISGYQTNQT